MELENFKKHIRILSKEEAEAYRNRYIEKYINTSSEYYKNNIETVEEFSDGLCYVGYLWDVLKSPSFINEDQIEGYRKFLKQVVVFWDNNSRDRIFIKDYWKFGKKDVIELDYNLLLDHLEFFPEDIYITDKTLQWTIVFTHEDDLEGNHLLMQKGLERYSVNSSLPKYSPF